MRPRLRRGWSTACGALALAASLGAQEPPPPGVRWLEVTGRGLRISSDAKAARVIELARQLEATRLAFLRIVGAPDHLPPYDTEVLAFRSAADFASYHRRADGGPPAGPLLAARDRRGRIVACSLEDSRESLAALKRMLVEDLVEQTLGPAPAWVTDGLASVLAELTFDARALRLVEGAASPSSAPVWPAAAALRGPDLGPAEEAAAELLVRYALQGLSDRSSQFRRYLLLLRADAPDDLAFDEAFGGSFDAFYAEVRAAVAAGRPLRPDLATTVGNPPAAQEMPVDARNVLLGDLVARTTAWNTVAAALHYDAVASESEMSAAARRGEAFLRRLDSREEDARELFEASLAQDSDDPATLLLYGWAVLEDFRRAVGARHAWEPELPAEAARARDLFARGLAISPRQPYLLQGLGAADLYGGPGRAAGRAALEQAHAELRREPEILVDLALARAHDGDYAAAWTLVRDGLDETTDSERIERTEAVLVGIELEAANELLQRGGEDEAEALLRATAERARRPELRDQIARLLVRIADVRRARTRDGWIERFNEAYERARELVDAGRIEEARGLLEPFTAADVDEEVRAEAEKLLARLANASP